MNSLAKEGYSVQQINDAIGQATIKMGVTGPIEGTNMPDEQIPTEDMQVSQLDQMEDIPVPAPEEEAPAEYSEMPQMPSVRPAQYPSYASPQPQYSYEEIQSLVEEVIDERWKEFLSTIGDITIWKSQMGDEQEAIKQEILRQQARIDSLQVAVLGKVEEYNQGIKEIGLEMKALEKVFEKILEPLSSNIKELNKVTETLRRNTK